MTALTDDTLPVTSRGMRDEMIVFVVMALLLASVPFTGVYPFFVMQGSAGWRLGLNRNARSRSAKTARPDSRARQHAAGLACSAPGKSYGGRARCLRGY
jgi:hypothetical protein